VGAGKALGLAAATAGLLGCAYPPVSPAPSGAHPDGMTASAVSTVSGEDLRGIPTARVEELLEGRSAGVQVIRWPGGGISVRIRGRSSIYGDNEPLYVIDGMPVEVTTGHGLSWLNPGDIQRIEVLKDASATAVYGMRGANGVVLITTRHGERAPE
jgi:TonB-dependent SusC/RagA subfamily outer membrane receptor